MFWEEKELHKRKNTRIRRVGRVFWNLIILCLAGFFVYAAYHLYLSGIEYYNNWRLKEEMKDLFYAESNVTGVEMDEAYDILAPIKAVNQDTVAWITVEGTKINYPVLKGSDNLYYQNHNIKGEDSKFGSIFMDAGNDPEERPQNFVIYGNRSKDGSMMSNLFDFEEQKFAMNNSVVTLYMNGIKYDCDVFSVYQSSNVGGFVVPTRFTDNDEYFEYLNSCNERSMFDFGVKLRKKNSIVTLICMDKEKGINMVVQAKMRKSE